MSDALNWREMRDAQGRVYVVQTIHTPSTAPSSSRFRLSRYPHAFPSCSYYVNTVTQHSQAASPCTPATPFAHLSQCILSSGKYPHRGSSSSSTLRNRRPNPYMQCLLNLIRSSSSSHTGHLIRSSGPQPWEGSLALPSTPPVIL